MNQLKSATCRGMPRVILWVMADVAAAAAGSAWAETTAPTTASGTEDVQALPMIIVTAQKREQTAQSVPVSLAVFSGKSLSESGVTGVEGLDRIAAGLTVDATQPGQLNLTMRGIANLGYSLLRSSSSSHDDHGFTQPEG